MELKSSPPLAVDKFSLSDVESVCGSSKLSEDEKMELLRVTFLLDSKGYKLLKLITVTCFGYIINVQQKN